MFNSQRSFNCLFFAGIFFVLPCIESYQKVDLRTITLGVPPQEVHYIDSYHFEIYIDKLSMNFYYYVIAVKSIYIIKKI